MADRHPQRCAGELPGRANLIAGRRGGRSAEAGALDSDLAGLPGPVRTCVGCRTRATKTTLLRVVAICGVLVPDPGARLPGRGASVHLDLRCVELAEKRRAFSRALRLDGPLDVTAVKEHVEGQNTEQHD